MGIKYRGIDLVYSKSIDYFAYPGIAQMTEQRGATLITLSQDGQYRIEQVELARLSWIHDNLPSVYVCQNEAVNFSVSMEEKSFR